ncbi:hypothetical protein L484_004436 [Morus notabilis]|uniref:Uncharacterized protein n=1 Tax=Morus notabilis TaxID=981085 RepID=W9RX92_9ROSA|nr:hypothetical protein L484_004436 [Morus notabilis]
MEVKIIPVATELHSEQGGDGGQLLGTEQPEAESLSMLLGEASVSSSSSMKISPPLGDRERMLGLLPEVISPEKPAVYRPFKQSKFLQLTQKSITKEVDGKSLGNHLRL